MKLKLPLFYVFTWIVILSVILLTLNFGGNARPQLLDHSTSTVAEKQFSAGVSQVFSNPLILFILQLIVIIFTCQVLVVLVKKMGQPAVIGEMIAGIVLGPSLAGNFFPEFNAFLFPKSSMGNLQLVSQLGLILFMFVIGMELNIESLKKKAKAAVVISHASILIPYMLGVILALFLYKYYAPGNIQFYSFALFAGIAMSITAFPVLARIIKERNMVKTRLGTIALTCAAADDITAWCLLAFVIAIVKAGSIAASLYTIVLTMVFIGLMIYVVKPWLRKVMQSRSNDHTISRGSVGIVFMVLMISAFVSELIGIHALFGAFLAGATMPQIDNFKEKVTDKTEDVATVLLLPLFFVFTGLRTQVGLLNSATDLIICFVIIIVAIIGKFGGSALAAKLTGESNYNSLSIGALMNTRGLVELVVLNIGYDLGILTPRLFTMFVIMALVTTFMTNPVLNLINRRFPKEAGELYDNIK
ncbi:MAG TPA: cation:proton antiporter [Flavipsychrobacter sp.]|nr:cation:proton antiporter [Flavipsychrobacter sp.]